MENQSNANDFQSSNITFSPPVYIQRYSKVLEMLGKETPRKVVDFGCAECKLLQLIAREEYVEELCGVDINSTLLEMSTRKIEPLIASYLNPRPQPLTISLFQGSVLQSDKRFEDFDAVTCVELVEHLLPNDLNAFIVNIFNFIQPKLVIISTPNADFNVLFNESKAFRHPDHKFEWSQLQFQKWCLEICDIYNYSVRFDGVGTAPNGSKNLGFCSQFGIFSKNADNNSRKTLSGSTNSTVYNLIAKSVHPFKTKDQHRSEMMFKLTTYLKQINFACFIALQRIVDHFSEEKVTHTPLPTFEDNYKFMFRKKIFSCEEGQFLNDDDKTELACQDYNTYNQSKYPVKVVPLHLTKAILYKLHEKFSSPSHHVQGGQFDNADEPNHTNIRYWISMWQTTVDGEATVDLSVHNSGLPFCVCFTLQDVTDDEFICNPTFVHTNDTFLRIPIECLRKLHGLVNITSCDLKEIVSQNSEYIIHDVKVKSIMMKFNSDCTNSDCSATSSEDSCSDNSSDTENLLFDVGTFNEKNWDSD
ncbi:small RNA 2'-O-methyltransferase-like isoform X1 [Clavelina lepadiformis]|uniref:small RNA 2'-O-methyltransferase-like isoform X1 n=2 Tax=Clavelina lepadiformis TaxID=159417 RepID=UPI0040415315